ncbi:uncharacterized protein LOC108704894 [Xenopus laevis]|uniref:Uncharacterized protein LOC108704894 n=1 Tax=Xenopus laevis TaxID=8355 RepID=A0A8J1KT82_XENLA|nr:uncharacterized protein LOC108704894 [Xenopus laevis]
MQDSIDKRVEEKSTIFRAKSDFDPVVPNISLRTYSCMIDAAVADFPQQVQHRGNLTKEERIALKSLQKNTDIIVKPADKGGAVVVMDYDYYRSEILSQLSDVKCYRRLNFDPTSTFQAQLGKLLRDACMHGWITETIRDGLTVTHPHWPIVKSDVDLTALNRRSITFGHRRHRNLKELLSPTDPGLENLQVPPSLLLIQRTGKLGFLEEDPLNLLPLSFLWVHVLQPLLQSREKLTDPKPGENPSQL